MKREPLKGKVEESKIRNIFLIYSVNSAEKGKFMSKNVNLSDLMKAGVHFGHRTAKWHPKMKPFIFTEKQGVHIIDLEKTAEKLQQALDFVKSVTAEGGKVLFLGTKSQARPIVKKAAEACGMPYIVSRWLGGTLTNSKSVLGVVKKYNKLKEQKETGKLDKYTKKERLTITREIERLEELVGGIASLDKVPNAIFIVDVKEEKTAVLEANKIGLPIVAICDTNVNPEKITYPIPGNDDASNSIKIIANTVAEAISEAKVDRQKTSTTEKAVEKTSKTK